ncbi:allophanate hydrolase [Roseobacter cerasinus]|uniref:Allophanate hydrolase n=1 Tax=Roseobacter cerasinus TaxID=2602289 RepID=A0A640VVX4_9RHOB|nr:cupin domain-containing protein [Roseobacter cerasinus]GFE51802.1 allophanate hydrolase [Roseobacter cerasinus]
MDEPVHISDLLTGGWRDLTFTPFREGIEISWLLEGEPGIAVLRYSPGAAVPRHCHVDAELILVLDGSQSDEHGTYSAGDIVINPKNSSHRVWSNDGCVVLLHWSKTVAFLD